MTDISNVVDFDPMLTGRKLTERYFAAESEHIAATRALAIWYYDTRKRYSSNQAFRQALLDADMIGDFNDHDRAALVAFGEYPDLYEQSRRETDQASLRYLREGRFAELVRLGQLPITTPEPESPVDSPETAAPAGETEVEPVTKSSEAGTKPPRGGRTPELIAVLGEKARPFYDRMGDTKLRRGLSSMVSERGGKQVVSSFMEFMGEHPDFDMTGGEMLSLKTVHSGKYRDVPFAFSGCQQMGMTVANLKGLVRLARARVEAINKQLDRTVVTAGTNAAAEAAKFEAEAQAAAKQRDEAGPWFRPVLMLYRPMHDQDIVAAGIVVRKSGERPNNYPYEWRTFQFLDQVDRGLKAAGESHYNRGNQIATIWAAYIRDMGFPDIAQLVNAVGLAMRSKSIDMDAKLSGNEPNMRLSVN